MKELSKRFEFKEVDERLSSKWDQNNTFGAKANKDKKPYTIVIPPPNVTGILHMGHALNNTLQDIIMRYKRMSGCEALWMPGTDHAGIATQNVVERKLAKECKTRQDVGREKFIENLWEWKKEYGDTIIHQLKKLGSSCDWARTRFTMDDDYSFAVKKVFVDLYKKDLIYKGSRIINWCPRCLTALSDEEAEHCDSQGALYHIKYPFKDLKDKYVIVATTRPETMLGDTAVAVNPNDERYKDLIGQILVLPIVGREIKIIADDFVDPAFGTGAVKVTPAHDPNDFEMGKRHDLEFVNVMHENAVMNNAAGEYEGMDRFEAREAIVDTLKQLKSFEKIVPHNHAVGHCYRCHTVVEPYLSSQWFVKMAPLAKPAIEAVESGKIKFHPERWTKVYMNWMENIRDWCISRQIWWGHRIPVWYCQNCDPKDNMIVDVSEPKSCPKCNGTNLKQDEDVLDTWFSSWLWPFATLNWPKDNEDLKYFYPTSSLFTASEIIFFWVARMVMAGIEFMGDIPFEDVYIHGTVRDAQGRKMSKSLGNAIDPLEIIEEYGADALRYSLIVNSGQDLFISKEKFEIGRNFANKIWNASRLILMNVGQVDESFSLSDIPNYKELDLSTKWIISRLFSTIENVGNAIESYKFSEAEILIHEFFWGNFCDWYLETIKDKWKDKIIGNIVVKILEASLKIMNPFMPFVTEEIYANLYPEKEICLSSWPLINKELIDPFVESKMNSVIEMVIQLRNLKSQWNINVNKGVGCIFVTDSKESKELIEENISIISRLAKLEDVEITSQIDDLKNVAVAVVSNVKCLIPLGDVIDVEQEKNKIKKQIADTVVAFDSLQKRLTNQNFVERAPKDVIEKEQIRLKELDEKLKELKKVASNLI